MKGHGLSGSGPKLAALRAERDRRIQETGLSECAKCGVEKPLSEFPSSRKKRNGQPRYSYCKPCHKEVAYANRIRILFGLTVADYDAMLESQGGGCAICGNPPRNRRLSIDHDHKTGLVRGLLCTFCNRAIGLFRDDIERFEAVVAYLRKPPSIAALGGERFGVKGRTTNKAATRKRLNKDMIARPIKEAA